MKTHPRILIVDDSSKMRRIIVKNLNKMDYTNIIEAPNGNAALKILYNEKIDYILSDWNMPDFSGFELLEAVRNRKELQEIPFILITAETNNSKVRKALYAGTDDFLVKPFTPDTFREKITKLFLKQRHVTSPIQPPQIQQSKQEIPEDKETTILIVDDTPVNIDVIRNILAPLGHRMVAAKNGNIALEIITSSPPDLILLDIMMPKMDGFEVCEIIKNNPETSHIPIIFLTAKDETSDVVKGLELGAADYITKPIEPRILTARVKTQLELKWNTDQLRDQIETVVENANLQSDVERITRHDLKTPLTAILNTVEHLYENTTFSNNDLEQLNTIKESAYDILKIVNGSLNMYKMERKIFSYTPIPVDIVSITKK